jgi:hypothetical protein
LFAGNDNKEENITKTGNYDIELLFAGISTKSGNNIKGGNYCNTKSGNTKSRINTKSEN